MHTVVKEESVTDFIDREAQNHPRLREVIRGLEWLLSRTPEQEAAEEVPGAIERFGRPVYLIKTEDLRFHEAGPPLRLLYYVEEETVVFWGIGFDEP
jgi:hypothetical protein